MYRGFRLRKKGKLTIRERLKCRANRRGHKHVQGTDVGELDGKVSASVRKIEESTAAGRATSRWPWSTRASISRTAWWSAVWAVWSRAIRTCRASIFPAPSSTAAHAELPAGRQGRADRLARAGNSSGADWHRRRSLTVTGWCRCRSAITTREAMAIGTAGLTAMLAVMALEAHGLTAGAAKCSSPAPPAASARWRPPSWRTADTRSIASSGRPEAHDYLMGTWGQRRCGSLAVRGAGEAPARGERWAGCIDSVGGNTLGACAGADPLRGLGRRRRPRRRQQTRAHGDSFPAARRESARYRFGHVSACSGALQAWEPAARGSAAARGCTP
jgi:hypothetical protein